MNDSERPSGKIKRLNTNPEQFWQGFLKCMVKLEEAYGKEMTEGRAAIYFENLRGYSIGEIEGAVNQAILEQEFFPTVARLIRLLEEQREEKGERWSTLYLKHKEESRLSPEEAKKGLEMIYKRLAETDQKAAEEQKRAKEEKKTKEEDRKRVLAEQKVVVLNGSS